MDEIEASSEKPKRKGKGGGNEKGPYIRFAAGAVVHQHRGSSASDNRSNQGRG
jgi:hypothetical protein